MTMAAPSSSLLNAYIVTFNCGRNPIDIEAFATHLFRPYTNRNNQPLPDLLVIAVQEIAPIAYSFLGGSLLSPYFARLVQAVRRASTVSGSRYNHLTTHHAGLTGILVFARVEVTPRIQGIQTADVGVGVWNLGNKGAAAVRLAYSSTNGGDPTVLTFVAAHLAPMEDAVVRRNLDWENIVRGLGFRSQGRDAKGVGAASEVDGESESEPLVADSMSSSIFVWGSPIFMAGDLNYRSRDSGPGPNDYISFPKPASEPSEADHFSQLFKTDQLRREMEAGRAMQFLTESQVDFPPTYKYATEQQNQALKDIYTDDGDPSIWLWAHHRWPSWTDRILFSKALNESDKAIKIIEYGALPVQPTSDHRPVALSFQLNAFLARSLTENQVPPFPLGPRWEERRAGARRLEVAVGILSYLSLTWEGNAIIAATLIGAVGGWYIMQSMASG